MMKKILLTFVVVLTVTLSASIFKAKAGLNQNMMGWVWGGNDQDGVKNSGDETGLGWTSLNNLNPGAGGIVDYGVNVPTDGSTTAIPSYAWSENYGWIDFGPTSNCVTDANTVLNILPSPNYDSRSCVNPDGSRANVTMDANGNLSGWARIVSIAQASETNNSGTWAGWIRMTPPNGNLYGVTVDKITGSFCKAGDPRTRTFDSDGNGIDENHCYAWSEELGFIDFWKSKLKIPLTLDLWLKEGALPQAAVLSYNLLNGQTAPANGTIGWTILTGTASSCTASSVDHNNNPWTWNGAKDKNGGSEAVNFSDYDITFTLNCVDSIDGSTVTKTARFSSVCENKSCDVSNNGVCNINSTSGTLDGDDCTQSCDCINKSNFNWKEVQP